MEEENNGNLQSAGGIVYSDNEKGNNAHSAADGKFVSKDGSGEGNPAAETPQQPNMTRRQRADELREGNPEEYQAKREAFLSKMWRFINNIWKNTKMHNSEKVRRLIEFSDEFGGVMEWEDLMPEMQNHFLDEMFSTKLFENTVAERIKDAFPEENLTGEWEQEQSIERDMSGSDYIFKRNDGSLMILDLKTSMMRGSRRGGDLAIKIGGSNYLSDLYPSGCLSEQNLTNCYCLMQIDNIDMNGKKMFDAIYKDGLSPEDIMARSKASVNSINMPKRALEKAVTDSLGVGEDDFVPVMNSFMQSMKRAISMRTPDLSGSISRSGWTERLDIGVSIDASFAPGKDAETAGVVKGRMMLPAFGETDVHPEIVLTRTIYTRPGKKDRYECRLRIAGIMNSLDDSGFIKTIKII